MKFNPIKTLVSGAVGFVTGGPVGAAVGVASSLYSDYEEGKAQKAQDQALGAANAQTARQLEMMKEQQGLIDTERDNAQARYDEQVKGIKQEQADVESKLQEAKQIGDAEAQRYYQQQLADIAQLETNMRSELDNYLQSGNQMLTQQQAREEDLLKNDFETNRALREQLGASIDTAMGDLDRYKAEQEKNLEATWMDAAMSDLEGQFRNIEAEQNRRYKGDVPEGVSLALAVQKARSKGALKAQLEQQAAEYRMTGMGNLSVISGQQADLATRKASALETNEGATLAQTGRYYGNQMLNQQNQAALSGMDITQMTSEMGMGAEGALHQENQANAAALNAGQISNIQSGNNLLRAAGSDLGATNTQLLSMRGNAVTGQANVLGAAASSNLALAQQANAAKGEARADLVKSGIDLGKWIWNKYGGTGGSGGSNQSAIDDLQRAAGLKK